MGDETRLRHQAHQGERDRPLVTVVVVEDLDGEALRPILRVRELREGDFVASVKQSTVEDDRPP